jgi:hypothetical protein
MFIINIYLKPEAKNEYNTYSFKVSSNKQMHFCIQNVYKICYNNINRLEAINIKTNKIATFTSRFQNIRLSR